MRKSMLLVLGIAMVAILASSLAAGCSDADKEEFLGAGGPNGILDESDGLSDAPDLIVEPVALEWDGLGGDAAVEAASLTLKVRSQSRVGLNAGIGIECNGLLGKKAVVALGEVVLGPGEETTLEIPATGLPIQNAAGASQLYAIAVVQEEDAEPDARPQIVNSNTLYYKFDAAYENATFFSKEVLKRDFGGCLAGVCTGNTDKDQVLGRIADGEGGFTDVTLAEQTATTTVDGVVVAHPDGMSIGAGDHPDVF